VFGGGAGYDLWFGGHVTPLLPQSFFDSYGVSDISENGTAVGIEYALDTELAVWPLLSQTPRLTPGPPVVGDVSSNEGITIDALEDIWTWEINPTDTPDGYKNGVELGNVTYINNQFTGTRILPVRVNNQGDMASLNASLSINSYYMNNDVLNFNPSDISNEINGRVFVAGIDQVTNTIDVWDSQTQSIQTVPRITGTSAPYASLSAATTLLNGQRVPAIQMVDNFYLWTMNPATGQFGAPQALNDLIPSTPSGAGWSLFEADLGAIFGSHIINDNGVIAGQAYYTPTGPNDPIPAGNRGVLLLPCQFSLLNGAQSGPDGKDFNGNRPTTISATSNYASSTMISNAQSANQTNIIGTDPLGTGRSDAPFAGNSYISSLMMLAKVSPPAATNITYGWNRTYSLRAVAIAQTATNTWYVTAINFSTGIPTPKQDLDSSMYGYQTTVPSTNNNVVAIYDDPGMYISPFTNYATHIGDYAYQKRVFTYSLTNAIGTASAIATQQVGTYILARRGATNGVVATDWTGKENITCTTNIPDCSTVTIPEIRAIVSPSTNTIILDPSVTNNYP